MTVSGGAGAVSRGYEGNVPSAARGPGNRRTGKTTGVCSAQCRQGSACFQTPRRTGTAGSDRDGRREFLAPAGPKGPVVGARVSRACRPERVGREASALPPLPFVGREENGPRVQANPEPEGG